MIWMLGPTMLLAGATVGDAYESYLRSIDFVRDPILGMRSRVPVSDDPEGQRRLAQLVMMPIQEQLTLDLERIAVEATGALPGDLARDDINGDGVVTLADWDLLVTLVRTYLTTLLPMAVPRQFGLATSGELTGGDPATASSPGTLASKGRLVADSDGDGVQNLNDNCPKVANPDQANVDGDALGDACDPDLDGDGIPSGWDRCPDENDVRLDADADGCLDRACDLPPMIPLVRADEGVRNSLQVKADQACEKARDGHTNAARGALNAFINEAEAQAGVHVGARHASALVRFARNALETLPAE